MLNIFFKSIFFLCLFSTFIQANENTNQLNKDIAELKIKQQFSEKLTDEKIKLLMSQIIEKENDIKELQKQLNQSILEKEKIRKDFEKYNNIIDRQDNRIEDFNLYFFWYCILITVLLFGITFVSYKFTSNEAKDVIDKWIKNNKNEILEPIRNEAKELQKNIGKEALEFYQEQLKKLFMQDKLDESQQVNQKEILKKVNELLEKKEKDEYTYYDWYSKYLSYENKRDYKRALIYLDKAIKYSTTNFEKISALFSKASLFRKLERFEEEVEVYDELINRFKDSKENNILEKVASALLNKGVALGEQEKNKEAIEIYEEVIKRFKDSKENNILENVASALYNKGVAFGKQEKNKEAVEVYDEVIKRFKDSKENNILETVANTLLNKIEINLINNTPNGQEDLDLFIDLVKDKKEKLIIYKMLILLENAKEKEIENEIADWKEEFDGVSTGDWSFTELKTWAKSLEDVDVKDRLLKYIGIFENHIKEYKNKYKST